MIAINESHYVFVVPDSFPLIDTDSSDFIRNTEYRRGCAPLLRRYTLMMNWSDC